MKGRVLKPISFHDREALYASDDSTIGTLPVLPITYGDGCKGLISCWKPGLRDILRIFLGKLVYLVLLGTLQPPILLSTNRNEVVGSSGEQRPDPNYLEGIQVKPNE